MAAFRPFRAQKTMKRTTNLSKLPGRCYEWYQRPITALGHFFSTLGIDLSISLRLTAWPAGIGFGRARVHFASIFLAAILRLQTTFSARWKAKSL